VTYKTALDWMIGFIEPYTFTQFGTTGNYSAIAIQHTLQFTVAHGLGFAAFTSRILVTVSSHSHCSFKSHVKSSCQSLIPFLPFLQLPIPKTRLDYSRLLLYTPSTLFLLLLSCRTLLITTLLGSHGKHRLLLSRMRVYWSVT
jgi:hypothetical protein